MVRAAAQAGRDAAVRAVGQRRPRGRDRRADRPDGARSQLGRPLEADLALLREAQRAAEHVGDVARLVRQRQLALAGRAAHAQRDAARVGRHALAQQAVLADGKPMTRRQRQDVRVEVESDHGPV